MSAPDDVARLRGERDQLAQQAASRVRQWANQLDALVDSPPGEASAWALPAVAQARNLTGPVVAGGLGLERLLRLSQALDNVDGRIERALEAERRRP